MLQTQHCVCVLKLNPTMCALAIVHLKVRCLNFRVFLCGGSDQIGSVLDSRAIKDPVHFIPLIGYFCYLPVPCRLVQQEQVNNSVL